MKKNYPSDEQDRFLVRMPEGMRQRIAEVAKANGRSMNAEIVARLEASFENRLLPTPDPHKMEEMLTETLARVIESGKFMDAIEKTVITRREAMLKELSKK